MKHLSLSTLTVVMCLTLFLTGCKDYPRDPQDNLLQNSLLQIQKRKIMRAEMNGIIDFLFYDINFYFPRG